MVKEKYSVPEASRVFHKHETTIEKYVPVTRVECANGRWKFRKEVSHADLVKAFGGPPSEPKELRSPRVHASFSKVVQLEERVAGLTRLNQKLQADLEHTERTALMLKKANDHHVYTEEKLWQRVEVLQKRLEEK